METFAAVRLSIDSWRWEGVPFYIRAGKRLPLHATEVIARLRRPPLNAFGEDLDHETNYVRFRLSPEVWIAIGSRKKAAGEEMKGEQVELIARDVVKEKMQPYERLIGDAMNGDNELFTREDASEIAWRIVDPVLGDRVKVQTYEPGSWGPREALEKVVPPHGWIDPVG